MTAVRRLIAARHLALLVCAAALLLKLLVPAGYMIAADHGRLAIVPCSGTGPAMPPAAMPGMDHAAPGHDAPNPAPGHGKAEMPCAFAGLSAAALAAVDPLQLAALVAFVLALGWAASTSPAPVAADRRRPPPRGPPATF